MPDDPRRNTETPTTRANKASAIRWAIGIAILFILGTIAWWVSGVPRGERPSLVPQTQSEQDQPGDGTTQPPAVIPREGAGPESPLPVQPTQKPR